MRLLKGLMLAGIAAFTLAGCGGGGGGGDEGGVSGGWGAIAVAWNRGTNTVPVFIATNQPTEKQAELAAMKMCGDNCSIILPIQPGRCGAIYYSQTNIDLQNLRQYIGYDVADTKAIAETVAKYDCEKNSGKSCTGISGCG